MSFFIDSSSKSGVHNSNLMAGHNFFVMFKGQNLPVFIFERMFLGYKQLS